MNGGLVPPYWGISSVGRALDELFTHRQEVGGSTPPSSTEFNLLRITIMRKIFILALLCVVFMAQAVDSVTVSYGYGWEGYTNIPSTVVGDTVTLRVRMNHWDYSLDEFSLEFNIPQGLELVSMSRGRDLDMVVFGEDGEPYIYSAPLELNGNIISCKITDIGYEDLDTDGEFEPYGTIKFPAGSQEILFIDVKVLAGFESGTIVIDGYFDSTEDLRLYTPVCGLTEVVSYALVGVDYDRGDINLDGEVNINDVTCLVDKILNNEQ